MNLQFALSAGAGVMARFNAQRSALNANLQTPPNASANNSQRAAAPSLGFGVSGREPR